jgi:heme-degrading monooxygenase HmoA
MAFIMTRVQVGDYEAFKPKFDQDSPGTRKAAKGYRLFRSVDDPNEVFVEVEFDSAEDAKIGSERLRSSGVLEQWVDHSGPTVVEEVESVVY